MQVHQAVVSGQDLQYSVVNMLIINLHGADKVLPHRRGSYRMAICRECGLGIMGADEAEAVHLLLCTVRSDAEHKHSVLMPCARTQFDPDIIDYIYDAYDPEGKVA